MNPKRPMNVMLVEDGMANQRLAVALLTKWGYQVEVAEDGQEALDLFLARRDFDLILMDIQMPVMDGLEATRAIRLAEQTIGGHIPILAMTARNLPDDRRQCQLAGMDGFLAKPVRQQDFHAAIEKCFQTSGSEENALEVAPGQADNPLVDWNGAMDNVDNDLGILLSVVEASLEELPDLVQRIESQLASENIHDVQRLAHTIKASARAFSSPVLHDHSFAVEQAAGARDLNETRKLFELLKPLVERFIRELKDRQLR